MLVKNMKNKTKTSMILSTTIIGLLVVMLAPTDVFANHTPWIGSTLPNGDAELYFSCTSLNGMWVDYDWWSNCNTVKGEVQDAMSTFNGLGNGIDLTTSATHTDKIVYAMNLGSYSVLAEASYPHSPADFVRFNNMQHWSTSNGCDFANGYNLEYVANHELGHTVGLAHAAQSDNSMMVPNCDATKMSTVQSHDEAVLDALYP